MEFLWSIIAIFLPEIKQHTTRIEKANLKHTKKTTTQSNQLCGCFSK